MLGFFGENYRGLDGDSQRCGSRGLFHYPNCDRRAEGGLKGSRMREPWATTTGGVLICTINQIVMGMQRLLMKRRQGGWA